MSSTTRLDELEAAEIFLQVVRARGFAPAARVMGKSASSMSRAVAALEAHLGAQLLLRTTRRHHVTEAGRVYMEHATRMLSARDEAHEALSGLAGDGARGLLRVSMPVVVGERLLADHLAGFRAMHPQLRLELDLSDRIVPLVEGGFDLAIRVGRLADSALRAQGLGKVPMRLVASPELLERAGRLEHPSQLSRLPCLTVGPWAAGVEWSFWSRGLEGGPPVASRVDVPVEGVVHTTSPALGARLAVEGQGVLRTTEWVVRRELACGQLVEVLPQWTCDHPRHGGAPVHVVYAQGAHAQPPLRARVFVAWVKSIMAQEVLAPLVASVPA